MDDPVALISKQNLYKTCVECHENASKDVIQYRVHGTTTDFAKYPLMWVTAKIMLFVVVLVLIFFYSHSMLWFYREYKNRMVRWHTYRSRSVRFRERKVKKKSAKHYRRFAWQWRINHWAVAISVMLLVLTGMAVMYPDTAWATFIVSMLGGPTVFGIIHRTVGVIFLIAITGHIVVVLFSIVKKRQFQWALIRCYREKKTGRI